MTLTVEQRLALLERAVGDYTTRADMSNPPAELENGEYPLLFRQRQIGLAIDQCVRLVEDFAVASSNLQARVAALEARPSGSVQLPSGTPAVSDVVTAFAAIGIKIGTTAHAPLIIESKNGVGIYLQSDTDNTTGQRDPGTTYPQFFGVSISGDGGGGLFQNIIYPEDGTPAYIPDPTRMAVTWRIDRMGAMSVDVMTAGAQFAPGRYEVISNLGQCFVFLADMAGNMTFRMPQENSALFVEGGYGGNPSHVDGSGNPNGHRETKFRRRVALEGGWP